MSTKIQSPGLVSGVPVVFHRPGAVARARGVSPQEVRLAERERDRPPGSPCMPPAPAPPAERCDGMRGRMSTDDRNDRADGVHLVQQLNRQVEPVFRQLNKGSKKRNMDRRNQINGQKNGKWNDRTKKTATLCAGGVLLLPDDVMMTF